MDELAQFDLSADPSPQRLTLHSIRVVRDGNPVEQLGRARITTLPQESELEDRVYNGR